MAQGKALTKTELKRVVDVTNSCSHYAARDVTILLLTHLCGLRIGEVANLRIHDVIDTNGTIRTEIRLDAQRTKNNHARTIFVPKQMQRQLKTYLKTALKQSLHGFCSLRKRASSSEQTLLHSTHNAYMNALQYRVLHYTRKMGY
tara:strand:+ start:279 stop:713 length:435 start_codon:yes stop_codon:yes gene_type:complete